MKRLLLSSLLGCMLISNLQASQLTPANLKSALADGLIFGVAAPEALGFMAAMAIQMRHTSFITSDDKDELFIHGGIAKNIATNTFFSNEIPSLSERTTSWTEWLCKAGASAAALYGLYCLTSPEGRKKLSETIASPHFWTISGFLGTTALMTNKLKHIHRANANTECA